MLSHKRVHTLDLSWLIDPIELKDSLSLFPIRRAVYPNFLLPAFSCMSCVSSTADRVVLRDFNVAVGSSNNDFPSKDGRSNVELRIKWNYPHANSWSHHW